MTKSGESHSSEVNLSCDPASKLIADFKSPRLVLGEEQSHVAQNVSLLHARPCNGDPRNE